MEKREKSFFIGFMLLLLLQQIFLLIFAGHVLKAAGKKTLLDYDDMETELDQKILEERKRIFGIKENGEER